MTIVAHHSIDVDRRGNFRDRAAWLIPKTCDFKGEISEIGFFLIQKLRPRSTLASTTSRTLEAIPKGSDKGYNGWDYGQILLLMLFLSVGLIGTKF